MTFWFAVNIFLAIISSYVGLVFANPWEKPYSEEGTLTGEKLKGELQISCSKQNMYFSTGSGYSRLEYLCSNQATIRTKRFGDTVLIDYSRHSRSNVYVPVRDNVTRVDDTSDVSVHASISHQSHTAKRNSSRGRKEEVDGEVIPPDKQKTPVHNILGGPVALLGVLFLTIITVPLYIYCRRKTCW